jgi:hypothetical protein
MPATQKSSSKAERSRAGDMLAAAAPIVVIDSWLVLFLCGHKDSRN